MPGSILQQENKKQRSTKLLPLTLIAMLATAGKISDQKIKEQSHENPVKALSGLPPRPKLDGWSKTPTSPKATAQLKTQSKIQDKRKPTLSKLERVLTALESRNPQIIQKTLLEDFKYLSKGEKEKTTGALFSALRFTQEKGAGQLSLQIRKSLGNSIILQLSLVLEAGKKSGHYSPTQQDFLALAQLSSDLHEKQNNGQQVSHYGATERILKNFDRLPDFISSALKQKNSGIAYIEFRNIPEAYTPELWNQIRDTAESSGLEEKVIAIGLLGQFPQRGKLAARTLLEISDTGLPDIAKAKIIALSMHWNNNPQEIEVYLRNMLKESSDSMVQREAFYALRSRIIWSKEEVQELMSTSPHSRLDIIRNLCFMNISGTGNERLQIARKLYFDSINRPADQKAIVNSLNMIARYSATEAPEIQNFLRSIAQ